MRHSNGDFFTVTSQVPTLGLIRLLAGSRWRFAYEVLLDLTGACRLLQQGPDLDASSLLGDVVIEMRMAGRAEDAERLQSLSTLQIADSEDSISSLLVVLLSARNLRVVPKPAHRRFFDEKEQRDNPPQSHSTSNHSPDLWRKSDSPPVLFSNPFGADDVLRSRIPASERDVFGGSAEQGDLRVDVIASAAQFSLRQDAYRLHRTDRKVNRQDPDTTFTSSSVYSVAMDGLPVPRPASIEFSEKGTGLEVEKNDLTEHVHSLLLLGTNDGYYACSSTRPSPRRPAESIVGRQRTDNGIGLCGISSRPARVAARIAAESILHRSSNAEDDDITTLLARATACGDIYRDLLSYADAYSSPRLGRVLCATSTCAFRMAHTYVGRILRPLNQSDAGHRMDRNVPWSLLFAAEEIIDDMCVLARALCKVEVTNRTACAVIDSLHDSAERERGHEQLYLLFLEASAPYMEMLWDWVFDASCVRDIAREFFGTTLGRSVMDAEELCMSDQDLETEIERSTSRSARGAYPRFLSHDTALFALRAGRNRALLQRVASRHFVLQVQSPSFRAPKSMTEFRSICEELNAFAATLETRCVEDEALHSGEIEEMDFAPRTPTDTLVKEVGPFRLPCSVVEDDTPWDSDGITRLFHVHVQPDCPAPVSSSPEAASVSHWPPISLLYGKLLLEPLRRVDAVVQREVVTYFVQDLEVYEHLRVLKSLALLGAGDFAHVLVEQIDAASQTSREHERYIQRRASAAMTFCGTLGGGSRALRNRSHLATCLRAALRLSNADTNPLTERFSLNATSSSESHVSNLWDNRMHVEYRVEFPLNLVVSERCISMYSSFFDFFVRVLRVRKSLREMFLASRRNSSLRALRCASSAAALSTRRVCVSLWHFCWQAEHFVSIFGGYEFDQVLGSSWSAFEASWQNISSIWDLRDAHAQYLEDSIRHALLGERHKSVMGVINGAFDIVVNLESKLTAVCAQEGDCSPQQVQDLMDLLVSASASLRRRSSFLIDVLQKLLKSGSHPHLEDLLTRLNFNNFYSSSTCP